MNEAKKIAQNTLIQVIGKALTIAIALFGFGLMARYLGQSGYGDYSTVYAFLAIFGILVDLGLQMTTTQLISDPNENESQILSNALTIRLAASLLFLIAVPLLVLFFPYSSFVKINILIAAFGFVFSSLTSTLTSLFQKHLIMGKIVIAEVVAKLVYLGLIGLVVFFNWGLSGTILATVADSFLILAILIVFAAKKVILKPRFEPLVWKKIITKTWPIALTIALNLVYFKGDIIIMSIFRTSAETGLYGAPYKVLEVLINIAYLFLGLILPLLASAVAIKDFNKFKIVIQTSFDFLILMTIPMIVGGYFLGRDLMILMAGPDFAVSGEIIKILFLATGAIYLAGLFGYAVVALDKQKEMIKFYAINAVLSLTGYLLFIPRYSFWGAAWMTVFTEVFILITAAMVMKKAIGFLPKPIMTIKSLFASSVMAGFLYLFPGLNFALAVCLGALIYFIALYLFKGFSKSMVIELIKN